MTSVPTVARPEDFQDPQRPTADRAVPAADRPRRATRRHYLLCPPTAFEVRYAINPWMDPETPVDTALALRQWEALRATYEGLGHRVDVLEPGEGLPDMVFAANGALVVGGRALVARFTHPERRPESAHHRAWLEARGYQVHSARSSQEGEGDFLVVGDTVLAGYGFRTSLRAHEEVRRRLDVPVVSLELADPRFYHLDTALAVLDDETVAYYPPAFTEAALAELTRLFPDAIVASSADAFVLGLNVVSDGRHVVLPDRATGLAAQLTDHGFVPVPVDLSELLKAGGSVKCCTLELH